MAAGLLAGCHPAEAPRLPGGSVPQPVWTNSLGMRFVPVPGHPGVKMSIWETRVSDFDAFVHATGHDATEGYYYYENLTWRTNGKNWRDPGFEQTPDHAVIGISWGDAMAFCHWLTGHERARGVITARQEYRLPFDREWTAAAFPADPLPIATNSANYHLQMKIDPYSYTSPAGSFVPNANGFYDLAGNAWEYCMDALGFQGNYRVIRGGCWQNWHGRFLGVQARGASGVNVRISLYGFRVVLADEKHDEALREPDKTITVEAI